MFQDMFVSDTMTHDTLSYLDVSDDLVVDKYEAILGI